ncbi:hypothetical protein TeGR_g10801 [Tetraparma gracilis]|uniref:MYND-type domain-containing protein n=1 Tax=Tetraparma gracilis TaxID=2962635 RepID=A0ABQ6MQX2_9STRA|nr:hypothetical protein TeGR_g10801 [Tetraparma gracilis]
MDPDNILAQALAAGVSLHLKVHGDTADESWQTTTPIPSEVADTGDPGAIMAWWRDHQMKIDLESSILPPLKVKQKACCEGCGGTRALQEFTDRQVWCANPLVVMETGIIDCGATVSLCCSAQACRNRREREVLKRRKLLQKMIDETNSDSTKCNINPYFTTMDDPLSAPRPQGAHPLRVCASCGRAEPCKPKLQMCSRCKCAYFCDSNCMKKAWKKHKKVCVKPAPGVN